MVVRDRVLLGVTLLEVGCAATRVRLPTSPPQFTVHSIALPGAPATGVFMDYLAYDRAHHRVWVPAGNTGSVYVVDAANDQVAKVDGFPTAEVERRGTKRTVGPSSASVGDDMVYVGNRGDSSVCGVGAVSLRVGPCIKLDSPPDGLAYVPSTKELWVTTPRDKSITVIAAATAGTLTWKARGAQAPGGRADGRRRTQRRGHRRGDCVSH